MPLNIACLEPQLYSALAGLSPLLAWLTPRPSASASQKTWTTSTSGSLSTPLPTIPSGPSSVALPKSRGRRFCKGFRRRRFRLLPPASSGSQPTALLTASSGSQPLPPLSASRGLQPSLLPSASRGSQPLPQPPTSQLHLDFKKNGIGTGTGTS